MEQSLTFQARLVGSGKNKMTNAVVKCLKHMNDISNSYAVKIADGLLSTKEVEVLVDCTGENKNCVPPRKFKVCY